MIDPALVFRVGDFPEGMQCSDCRRVFEDGMVISEKLTGFAAGIPMVLLVCGECGVAGRAE